MFCCPTCKDSQLKKTKKKFLCKNNHRFKIVHNIPLLISNIHKHNIKINDLVKSNPRWYQSCHQKIKDSPWIHANKKRQAYLKTIFKKIRKKIKQPIALDAGCGDGVQISFLENNLCSKIIASDYNLIRLLRAQKTYPKNKFFLADLTKYPIINSTFDFIHCSHVLEHIPQDEDALKNLYNCLKKNGYLILGIPNEGCFWWQLAYWIQPYLFLKTDHCHFYTRKSIEVKLKKTGFTILETKMLGWGPPCWFLDALIRRYKQVDDFFEKIGKKYFENQASSMYIICQKK